MIALLLSFLTLLLLATSCTNIIDNVENLRPRVGADEDVVFYATIEDSSYPETKVFSDEQMRVLWNAGDQITVFNRDTYNQPYRFKGEDGDNGGGFEKVPSDNEFITGGPLSLIYAAYPYAPSTKVSYDGEITLSLPALQHYKEHSFGIGANTMVSVTEDNFLQFKNAGGYLSFKFYGEGISIKHITLKGNNHEKLAGKATVSMPLGGIPSLEMQETAEEAVRLECDTPVALNASAGEYTEFWFVLPPITFSHGFTVTVTDKQGGAYVETTQNKVVISRNALSRMQPLQIIPTPPLSEAVDLGLSVKWATCNVGASSPEDYGDYFAWGETEPKENYDWLTYKWCNGSFNTLTKYNTDSSYGVVDNTYQLELADDAARANWKGSWRMPTDEEWTELRTGCEWTWTTLNGVNGYLVVSKANANSIFLPAAGLCGYGLALHDVGTRGLFWSSTLYSDDTDGARSVKIQFDSLQRGYDFRCAGLSIRPVTK